MSIFALYGCNDVKLNIHKSTTTTPEFVVKNVSTNEGQSLSFKVELTSPLTTPATIHFTTADGTVLANTNYITESGTLTFYPGETIKTINVATTANPLEICGETKRLTFELSNALGAVIKTSSATGSIIDTDVPSISISDDTVVEGNPLNFPVTLSDACPTKDVFFSWTRSDGGTHTSSIKKFRLHRPSLFLFLITLSLMDPAHSL